MKVIKTLSLLIAATLFLNACSEDKTNKKGGKDVTDTNIDGQVIYGSDGRRDLYEITDSTLKQNADGVVALFDAGDIAVQGNQASLLTSEFGNSYGLCAGERFREQETGAFCSGALVGSDLILTAGHCVTDALSCANTRIVFGFNVPQVGQQSLQVRASEVYNCKSIVSRVQTNSGADYAVIRLDRAVAGHRPLKLDRRSLPRKNDGLVVMGHPAGLPLKITLGGKVRNNSNPDFIVASLDTYGGNSGSPVFGANGLIQGILVRGENDFVQQGSCFVSQRCSENSCRGEDVTRVQKAAPFIPEIK